MTRLAPAAGDPLLLVMGLAVSRFWWPTGLAQALADQGFAVARYDQRDAGQSTRMPDTGSANPFAALARRRGAYSSEDMTDDAVAVLDALGWERAHIFGASLGGIIAQRIALRHPDRVLSVVSAMAMPSDAVGIRGGRTSASARWPGSRGSRYPRARRGTSSSRSCSRGQWHPLPTRSTKTPPGNGSNARPTRVRGTPELRAGRSAPPGTAQATRDAQARPRAAR